jgi:hypothetical protein
VINADNGPENSGVRTQWLKRMMEFSAQNEVIVQLAYYPPYHSKYNPIERVFGVLEKCWNGDPLRTVEFAMGMARGMTYRGEQPETSLHKGGTKGVRVESKAMKILERGLERMDNLKKWFVKIVPEKAKSALAKLKNL